MMNPTTLHILEPIPKRREDPRVTANIAIADSLKALDFNRPNREEPPIAIAKCARIQLRSG